MSKRKNQTFLALLKKKKKGIEERNKYESLYYLKEWKCAQKKWLQKITAYVKRMNKTVKTSTSSPIYLERVLIFLNEGWFDTFNLFL